MLFIRAFHLKIAVFLITIYQAEHAKLNRALKERRCAGGVGWWRRGGGRNQWNLRKTPGHKLILKNDLGQSGT
jgi:hypothetical protein